MLVQELRVARLKKQDGHARVCRSEWHVVLLHEATPGIQEGREGCIMISMEGKTGGKRQYKVEWTGKNADGL